MPNFYLFPFELVEKNTRVIIYGAGKVGYSFYHQLKSSGYADCLFMVDRNTHKTVKSVDLLKTFDQKTYNYIVISVQNQNTQLEMRDYLISIGIPEHKIVIPRNPMYGFLTCLNLDELISSQLSFASEMEICKKFNLNAVEYFSPIVNEISDYNGNKDELKFLLTSRIKNCDSLDEQLVLHEIMYLAEVYDMHLMEQFVKNILLLENKINVKILLTFALTSQIFLYPQYCYDNFYLDRRHLFQNAITELNLKKAAAEYNKNPQKICIVVDMFNSFAGYSPIKPISQIANQLAKFGCEILIVAGDIAFCDANTLSEPIILYYSTKLSYEQQKAVKPIFNDNIKLFSSEHVDVCRRFQHILDTIFNFNPGIIFDMSDEMSPLSYLYHQYFPTVYWPFRGNASSQFFHKFVSLNKSECVALNKKFQSVEEEQILEFEPIFETPIPLKHFERQYYNFSEHDFLMITVSTRLKYELDKEFIDTVYDLLTQNESIKWIIVGQDAGAYIHKRCAFLIESKRIVLWGYENDLPGLYQMCDIYLNPDRVGGGISINWAMCQGLPVATTKKASAGAKLAKLDAVNGSYHELTEYVLKLASDKDFYQARSRRTKKRANENTAEGFAKKLMKHFESMSEEWAKSH